MAIDLKAYTTTKHKGIKVNKDHSVYLLEFKIDGKRYRRLFKGNSNHGKADNLKVAFIKREEHIAEVKNQHPDTQVLSDKTVDDYFATFLIRGKNGVRNDNVNKWLENYYKLHIQPRVGSMKVSAVQPVHINTIMDNLVHLSLRSQKTAYEILNPMFRRAVSDGAIKVSPVTQEHKVARSQKSEKRKVTDAVRKYKTVHAAIMKVYAQNPHHRALFLFGFEGRRKTETLLLRWQDIDLQNHTYTIIKEHNKVNEDMKYSMSNELVEALEEFNDTSGNVFNITWIADATKKIRIESKIPEFTFHWMRNLAVSALSTTGMNLVDLSAMLGHTSPDTLRQYLDIQREESSKKAVKQSEELLKN